jgi:hypothetical protein
MMKKSLITLSFILAIGFLSFGQATDQFVSNCTMNTGDNSRYLKDFRIQLGKADAKSELRYKVKMSLWKNTKYRFTMCSTEDSKGQLILNIVDDTNREILSSFDQKSGKIYPVVDFECQKSGLYQLSYDFTDRQQGSGVGVVSMVK